MTTGLVRQRDADGKVTACHSLHIIQPKTRHLGGSIPLYMLPVILELMQYYSAGVY